MYIEIENYNVLLEDFNDILIDYDIACEGVSSTASSILKQAISMVKRLLTQFYSFIINKLKNVKKSNKNKSDEKEEKEEVIKINITNWNIGNFANIISNYMGVLKGNLNLIPMTDFSKGIETDNERDLDQVIYSLNFKMDGILSSEVMEKRTKELKSQLYEGGTPKKITLDNSTEYGKTKIKEYKDNKNIIDHILNGVYKNQSEINREVQIMQNTVDSIGKNIDTEDKLLKKRNELLATMRAYVKVITELINEYIKDFNKIITEFVKDYNQINKLV